VIVPVSARTTRHYRIAWNASTRCGPVVVEDHLKRPLVWRWVAYENEALNLSGFQALERTLSAAGALSVVQETGMPGQNFVVGDTEGHIGWTIIGRIPRRRGDYDSRHPTDWSSGNVGWDGWLEPARYPQVIDPPTQRIWTANGRVASGEDLALLGDGGYALGARAAQIRDRLMALATADEADMLAIQLDDEARFLSRWRRLLLAELDAAALGGDPQRAAMRESVMHWSGRAAVDDAGYRLVREFRDMVRRGVMSGLTAHCVVHDAEDDEAAHGRPGRQSFTGTYRSEAPLWSLLNERPVHMLPPGKSDWRQVVLDAADAVIDEALGQVSKLEDYTWGKRNRLRMNHPLSTALPGLGYFLRMPATPLAGDRDMPRVQTPTFGASQRMAVSPGHEEDGYMELPGGQSGHPLSPYFSAGHEDWVEGRPTPFLPGAAEHELVLVPDN